MAVTTQLLSTFELIYRNSSFSSLELKKKEGAQLYAALPPIEI
ncbi:hypothetical protein PORCRE_234 [Porphyromonas crevioricanis JCM 15906]|uniref:Uncharacterized protein n=1 Tax=Porphyromonas crevioricanis JCM 15906 TaxID=1305617 RepID=S4N9C0_9PORP|nr:hypothetical protein PORCRE_234 [Porphyromonas crevioricanis JCM 15906]